MDALLPMISGCHGNTFPCNRCDTIIGTQINGHQIHIMVDINIQFSPSGRGEKHLFSTSFDHEFHQFWFRQSQVMVKTVEMCFIKIIRKSPKSSFIFETL